MSRAAIRIACALLLAVVGGIQASIAGASVEAGLTIQPDAPVEGQTFRLRLEGPFAQPSPILSVRVVGDDVIASAYFEDFADPRLPQVPYVEVATTAPPAGEYDLVHQTCAGSAPPGSPPCNVVATGTLQVSPAAQIPAASNYGLIALGLAIAAFALRHRPRASHRAP